MIMKKTGLYTIKITKQNETRVTARRSHTVIGQETNDEGVVLDVMGWPEQVEEVIWEEVTVLEQQVEDLDVPAVIAAVNGLKLARGSSTKKK